MSDRIFVTRALPNSAMTLLAGGGDLEVSPFDRPLSQQELRDAVVGSAALVTMFHDRVDADLLEAAGHQLQCVANVAVGYDNINVTHASERRIVVTNTPGVLTDATADLAIGLMLAVTRRIGDGDRLIRAETPWSWSMGFMLGTGLQGKTLGIVGLGAIGIATAKRARALGMKLTYASRREADPDLKAELDLTRLDLKSLLATADVVSLHCPLNEETRHLLNAPRLALMKPGAYLVNTARGPIIDEAALVDALAGERLAGAALDVFENEPKIHPGLVSRENVVLVPHLGSATTETRAAMADLAAQNVLAVLAGRLPATPVNDVEPRRGQRSETGQTMGSSRTLAVARGGDCEPNRQDGPGPGRRI